MAVYEVRSFTREELTQPPGEAQIEIPAAAEFDHFGALRTRGGRDRTTGRTDQQIIDALLRETGCEVQDLLRATVQMPTGFYVDDFQWTTLSGQVSGWTVTTWRSLNSAGCRG